MFNGDDVDFFVAELGEKIGIAIVVIVSAWDFIMMGIRHCFEWHIGFWGIVAIWVGLMIVWYGAWSRGYFEGRRN